MALEEDASFLSCSCIREEPLADSGEVQFLLGREVGRGRRVALPGPDKPWVEMQDGPELMLGEALEALTAPQWSWVDDWVPGP